MRFSKSQFVVILLALVMVAIGVAGSVAVNQIPSQFQPHLWLAWPVLAVLIIILIVLSSYQRGEDTPDLLQLLERLVDALKSSKESELEPKAPSPIPKPPIPHFAHRYPLQTNFTGRVTERQMLTEWLTKDDCYLLALIAIGGMGKSALTWAWLQRDVLGYQLPGTANDPPEVTNKCRLLQDKCPEGVLWWSFYESDARFTAFLDVALTYTSGGDVDPESISSTSEKVSILLTLLQERRFLLVLDGFERELRAYASLNAAYQGDTLPEDSKGGDHRACTDLHAGNFLRQVVAGPLQSRVLLTSRLFPQKLDNEPAGCRRKSLTELDPEDALAFFQAQGVKGTRAEIRDACSRYGYHPLTVRLLSGMIVKHEKRPGDVKVAVEFDPIPELIPKEHHILALSYDALRPPQQQLLSRLAAFRSPVDYGTIEAVFGEPQEDTGRFAALKRLRRALRRPPDLGASLRELVERGLLLRQEDGHYDLHPIVRQYAYGRLNDKTGVHTRLRDYFAAIPAPENVEKVEDLAPVIELYHHTVRSGRYDEARELYRDRLSRPLYYRFGAYQTCIELLSALFPDGEARPPRLEGESAQAWTLNALANSYSLSGQPRRAVSVFQRQISIRQELRS